MARPESGQTIVIIRSIFDGYNKSVRVHVCIVHYSFTSSFSQTPHPNNVTEI